MNHRWLGSIVFMFLFTLGLAILSSLFPYRTGREPLFDRSWILRGRIFGEEPETWIGDLPDNRRVAGKGGERRPIHVDIDFIRIHGQWYKVKGPIYMTRDGKIIGWHHPITREEAETLGKWLTLVQ